MSTTDQRTGFRLPWNSDPRAADSEVATDEEARPENADAPTTEDATPMATDADADGDATTEMSWPEVDRRVRQIGRRSTDHDPNPATVEAIVTRLKGGQARRANPLMAELSKAMHATAEAARTETLERLAADAATRIEAIRTGSTDEATALKQKADADIAAVREWSKAEAARIREETDRRIAARRADLEKETDAHAATVERRIERVRRAVGGFETQMSKFFEVLLAEEDPTRVALLAEQLPEPPSLELDDELEDAFEGLSAEGPSAEDDILIGDSEEVTETSAADDVETDVSAEAVAETATEPVAEQSAEPVAEANVESSEVTEAELAAAAELSAEGAAAAEAEAEAAIGAAESSDEARESDEPAPPAADIPALAEEAIAARLAGRHADALAEPLTARTELIVTGLVSVASIAGFKRDIGRVAGVHAVGVTSGPDGEFVFAVTHAPNVELKSAVAGLRGFRATVTGESDGVLRVAAQDRESQA